LGGLRVESVPAMRHGVMRYKFVFVVATAVMLAGMASADEKPGTATHKVSRTADGHPDLSGLWEYTIDLPPVQLKTEIHGAVSLKSIDRSARELGKGTVPGALPWTTAPVYKPEFREKVKQLFDNESKVDPVFYCGKPGVPRIGSPRRIIQLPGEMVFLYEDVSGDPYRIIPTDGRAHRTDANPSFYGDSVGHWEGDTLVVDVTNFLEGSWFGEEGYFHTDAMHVTERLWRDGDNLIWQAAVDDPKVLAAPWTMSPRVVKPSSDPLEESPPCIEDDGKRLLNSDHHQQR
jgi:hypothetical protein